ncbi:uncharacterized protein LOC110107353 [Dendrobium catenatum]|uniref:uncharacterized protein LOC110107353 n=1 Tax=Dendrobium catenatum TaxID=906689 RepID=UPI0009F2B064|nr:uncharacterized protein LOC110107353 [Dendrobium catenatum]
MESFSRKEVDKMVGKDWEFIFEPAIGNAGGILVLWKNAFISFHSFFKTNQCIMGKVCGVNGLSLEVAVVYANKDRYIRNQVWEDISKTHNMDAPLLVGGDFNCIMSQEDKKGGKAFHFSGAAGDMGNFMAANGLVDPGFLGPAYTWTNNKDARSRIFSRLDHFLISSSILDSFQGLKVRHLTRLASDHCPILCSFQSEVRRSYSHWIKFEDVWASLPKAWQLVWDKWKVDDEGNEACKLNKKCQRTLKALFFWSKNKVKMLNQLKEELDKEIKELQELECLPSGLTVIQEEALKYKVQLLNSTLARLMLWWKQRAKVRWIEEGDGNTRFFHSMASARRRTNSINSLKLSDGNVVSEQSEIMKGMHEFFEHKWKGQGIIKHGWPSFELQRDFLSHFFGMLDSEISREKIWEVVKSFG